MFGLGTQELIIILAIGGLLFGAKKLPELGKGLGEAIRGFRKSVSEPEEKAITGESAQRETPEQGQEQKEEKT